eukprot:353803-Chlamydomonas_euryale.AAC.2
MIHTSVHTTSRAGVRTSSVPLPSASRRASRRFACEAGTATRRQNGLPAAKRDVKGVSNDPRPHGPRTHSGTGCFRGMLGPQPTKPVHINENHNQHPMHPRNTALLLRNLERRPPRHAFPPSHLPHSSTHLPHPPTHPTNTHTPSAPAPRTPSFQKHAPGRP